MAVSPAMGRGEGDVASRCDEARGYSQNDSILHRDN